MECIRNWIQCSKSLCGKWRVVREEIAAKYADIPWTCSMNEDPRYNKCTVPEEKVNVPPGKKVVVTKFPYGKGDIIMGKMAGYCIWPAFITPDPNCDEYYDAVLNDNDDEEEITHIHVEFFGEPRTHAWIKTEHAFPYTGLERTVIKSKCRKSYYIAMEDAAKSVPLTCEERLKTCAFRFLGISDPKKGSQTLPDAKKEYRQQCNHNFPKRKGRPKKSVLMESSKSVIAINDKSCDLPLATEQAISSKRGRKRKAEKIHSSNYLTSNTATIINQSADGTGVEERNEAPLLSIREKSTQENKSRKTKSIKFISPFVASHVSDMNGKIREEMNVKLNAENAAPPLQVSTEHSQSSLKSTDAGIFETCVVLPSDTEMGPVGSLTSTKQNTQGSNFEPNLHSRKGYTMPVNAGGRSQMAGNLISLVPEASNLNLGLQDSSKTNAGAKTHTSISSTFKNTHQVIPPHYESEKYEGELLSKNSSLRPTFEQQHFTMVDKQSSKTCPEISGYEYVPSSNPNSPQIVPTKEDLEEDCGISIQRELEEMEKILQDKDSVDPKGLSPIKTLPFEPKGKKDRITLKDDAIKNAINDMLKLEEDISQLEDSTELDFV